jgi:hypothetical protein
MEGTDGGALSCVTAMRKSYWKDHETFTEETLLVTQGIIYFSLPVGVFTYIKHQIEQAKSTGKAADEQLKAYMAYIQGEDGVKFLNLKEDQERKRRIDAEIKRLKERVRIRHLSAFILFQV